ncbi:Rne/Rng family ribonuclease [Planctomycetota bacterium]|nr:Rne/Rng family ribonuclease [Planctomycetota bacterium]
MLINNVPGEECRIAIAVDGKLDEFYQERSSSESHVGNIYKGRVTNVEASIQAAFIDFGLERNGFLHISDLHPKYFPGKDKEEFEQVGSKTPRRDRPPIQKCLKRGQEIVVQVLKEGIGTKGPTLTSYLSIPGRFVVMMPDMQRLGVSRKVEDEDARRAMKKTLNELKPPSGFGFIVRTAGIGQTKTDLKRDLAYLARLWKSIEKRKKAIRTVGELYAESDLVIRTIRDVFRTDIERIVIDDITAAKRARDFLAVSNPRTKTKVEYYHDPVPLYHRFGIEEQIDQINAREVPLPSGGALVFDQAEALVAIDVNSGKSREAQDAESNAYNTNKEAVDEICRQLKLRDLGGLVVNDLIDMRESKHRRKIEARFRKNLKNDRARSRINPISQFGMLEMTRQRMRPSLKNSIYNECVHCAGSGHVKTAETVVLEVMRYLAMVMHHRKVTQIELMISPDVAFHLLNKKRSQLVGLERKFDKPVMVRVGGDQIDFVEIKAYDERQVVLNVENLMSARQIPKPTSKTYIDLAIDEIPVVEEKHEATENSDVENEISHLMEENAAREAAAENEREQESEEEESKRHRRRRRGSRGKKHRNDNSAENPIEAEVIERDEEDRKKKERESKRRSSGRGRRTSSRDEKAKDERKDDRREKREDREQSRDERSSVRKKVTRKKRVTKKRDAGEKSESKRDEGQKKSRGSRDRARKDAKIVESKTNGNVREDKAAPRGEVNGNVADHLVQEQKPEKKPIRRKRYTSKRVSESKIVQPTHKHKTKVKKKREDSRVSNEGNREASGNSRGEERSSGNRQTPSRTTSRKKTVTKKSKTVRKKRSTQSSSKEVVASSGYSNRMLKK